MSREPRLAGGSYIFLLKSISIVTPGVSPISRVIGDKWDAPIWLACFSSCIIPRIPVPERHSLIFATLIMLV